MVINWNWGNVIAQRMLFCSSWYFNESFYSGSKIIFLGNKTQNKKQKNSWEFKLQSPESLHLLFTKSLHQIAVNNWYFLHIWDYCLPSVYSPYGWIADEKGEFSLKSSVFVGPVWLWTSLYNKNNAVFYLGYMLYALYPTELYSMALHCVVA